jgi:ribosome-binding protein aMBF1 (putative translation factor)
MKDLDYRRDHDALEGEFALATALIRARADAGLTQEELAERMATSQEVVVRREGGEVMALTQTLARLAKATGIRVADYVRAGPREREIIGR